ncbi:hypothetical protein UlMin_007066 [Ulmus minor]
MFLFFFLANNLTKFLEPIFDNLSFVVLQVHKLFESWNEQGLDALTTMTSKLLNHLRALQAATKNQCRFGDHFSRTPFEGLKFVDVGRAMVTRVDAVDKNIKIARLHVDLDPLTSKIDYCCTTAGTYQTYVIEHVKNPGKFCKSLSALTVPNGDTIISTINRSMRAYATAIVAVEYLLHWFFLTLEKLVLILQRASISGYLHLVDYVLVKEMAGFGYNPLTRKWSVCDYISVNFIAFGTKTNNFLIVLLLYSLMYGL